MVIKFVSIIIIMLKYVNFIARLIKFIIIISLEYLDCSYMIRIN